MVASIDSWYQKWAHKSVYRASPNPFCLRKKIVLTHGFTGFFELSIFYKHKGKDVEILGYIKVYFSEQEKEILQNAAKEQNLAVSQLIKQQCHNILNPTYAIMPSLLNAKDLAEHNGDKYIKVFLSEDEHEKLQNIANERGMRMSRLIYEKLHSTSVPIEITYKTDDIYELITMITDTYRHLIGVAEGLMRRNTIYERDKERLLTLGYEIRDTLKEYVKHTYRNRNAIRKNAVRHMNKKIDTIIKEQYAGKEKA